MLLLMLCMAPLLPPYHTCSFPFPLLLMPCFCRHVAVSVVFLLLLCSQVTAFSLIALYGHENLRDALIFEVLFANEKKRLPHLPVLFKLAGRPAGSQYAAATCPP